MVVLQPRGMEYRPRLASEVVEAVRCVLEALLVRFMATQSGLAH